LTPVPCIRTPLEGQVISCPTPRFRRRSRRVPDFTPPVRGPAIPGRPVGDLGPQRRDQEPLHTSPSSRPRDHPSFPKITTGNRMHGFRAPPGCGTPDCLTVAIPRCQWKARKVRVGRSGSWGGNRISRKSTGAKRQPQGCNDRSGGKKRTLAIGRDPVTNTKLHSRRDIQPAGYSHLIKIFTQHFRAILGATRV